MKPKTYIGTFALTMLMTGAIDGISNLPTIALFGLPLIFFFVVGSLLFLLPTGLISAELCTQYKEESGVYVWSKKAFGSHFAALTIWLQWINTVVWFPTCLTTLIGTAAFLFNPALTHNPLFLVFTSLAIFWLMTVVNLKGIKTSTGIASFAAMIGTMIPMFLIIGLSVTWLILGKPLALHLNSTTVYPPLRDINSWTALTAIITAFLGMELAAVHVKKVHNAHIVFPKALIYTILLILLTMGLGSLGIALIIPHQQIVLVSGTIQAFSTIFNGLHLTWLAGILGFMLIFGSFGTVVNWLISPANGLAQAAHDGYLSKKLAMENEHGVPTKILLLQGVVVSIVLFAFFLMPSINGSYWLLIDLSTELYLFMYLFMFIAAFKLMLGFKKIIVIPGGKLVALLITLLGIIGCSIAIIIGFIPPSNIDIGSADHYVLLFSSGLAIMILPAFSLMWYKNKK